MQRWIGRYWAPDRNGDGGADDDDKEGKETPPADDAPDPVTEHLRRQDGVLERIEQTVTEAVSEVRTIGEKVTELATAPVAAVAEGVSEAAGTEGAEVAPAVPGGETVVAVVPDNLPVVTPVQRSRRGRLGSVLFGKSKRK